MNRQQQQAWGWALAGVAGGILAGLAITALYQERHAQALFSGRTRRRWAALGHLATAATVDSVPLVREYVAWESHPILRRRGQDLLQRLLTLQG
jgi:hypothetical protein